MAPRQNCERARTPKQAWTEVKAYCNQEWFFFTCANFLRFVRQLDGRIVTPGFAYNIARYFPSASEDFDREKCMEVMEKLGVNPDPVKWYSLGKRLCCMLLILTLVFSMSIVYPADRPQTASPRDLIRPKKEKINIDSFTRDPEVFYLTTNRRDFAANFGAPSANAR